MLNTSNGKNNNGTQRYNKTQKTYREARGTSIDQITKQEWQKEDNINRETKLVRAGTNNPN